jgi:hypothetical protein
MLSVIERFQFFDAVLEIPAPIYRKHELLALKKRIPRRPAFETQPTVLTYFLKCEAFATCTREDFVAHLAAIGVWDPDSKIEWSYGRGYQFIALEFEFAKEESKQIARYTFRGSRVKIESKVLRTP